MSYEMLAKCIDELQRVRFDVIVCDEGHRLKNSNIKAAVALDTFACKRRIILTGEYLHSAHGSVLSIAAAIP